MNESKMIEEKLGRQQARVYSPNSWCNSVWKRVELPQLLNVFRGDMSFVGPRPQPTKLWKGTSIQEQASYVLAVRPGITSYATLNFRNEEELLAPLTSEEVEDVYLKTIMPV